MKTVHEYWSKEVTRYDHYHPQLRLFKKIITQIQEAEKRKLIVLDIGSSVGTLGKMLNALRFEYHGMDFYVSNNDPYIVKHDLNSLPLPYANASHHLVILGGSIEYAKDLPKIIQEAHRIIKNDGWVIARYINRSSYIQRILTHVWPAKKGNPYMHQWRSLHEFKQLLLTHFKDFSYYCILSPTPLNQPQWMSKLQAHLSCSKWLAKHWPAMCSQMIFVGKAR